MVLLKMPLVFRAPEEQCLKALLRRHTALSVVLLAHLRGPLAAPGFSVLAVVLAPVHLCLLEQNCQLCPRERPSLQLAVLRIC